MVLHSDAIVLLSENDKKEFHSNGISIPKGKILCGIPNPNSFPTKENACLSKKEKIVLYVGRFDQFEKNILCLIRIWELIHKNYPEWRLMLVGDGPDRKRVEEYIKKKAIKNICLEGEQKDVEVYYQKSSFICLTSFYEGWGMSLTEGMSNGCIPFTFDNYGASRDIIDDGINGCLIKAFNEKEYANRLSELMNDEDKRIKMGKAALEKAKEFSIEKVITKWETLIQNLNKKESV